MGTPTGHISGIANRFDPIVIGFDGIKDGEERKLFEDLPTRFKLSAGSVDCLRTVAATLLIASPDYQKHLKDLI